MISYQEITGLLIQNMLLKLRCFTDIDVAINKLDWRFEGQRQIASLFKFLFQNTLLKPSNTELENETQQIIIVLF